MLRAIYSLYRETKFTLRTASVNASIGVRQGAPTSCLLFTAYVDQLSQMLKSQHTADGFLGGLHLMLLMDDTIIMSTTRKEIESKLSTLQAFCDEYGMLMNHKKTQLMVINGSQEDRASMMSGDVKINHTDCYVYLGSYFTSDAKMTSVMKHQRDSAMKHVNKFAAFISKNANMPYELKRKVFDAALTSAMLYGSEGWFTKDMDSMNKLYMRAVKVLLGVRATTPNTLCLIEAGLSELQAMIMHEKSELHSEVHANGHLQGDEPLSMALQVCGNTGFGRQLQE